MIREMRITVNRGDFGSYLIVSSIIEVEGDKSYRTEKALRYEDFSYESYFDIVWKDMGKRIKDHITSELERKKNEKI